MGVIDVGVIDVGVCQPLLYSTQTCLFAWLVSDDRFLLFSSPAEAIICSLIYAKLENMIYF